MTKQTSLPELIKPASHSLLWQFYDDCIEYGFTPKYAAYMMYSHVQYVIAALIEASAPFTSGDIVDETSGTGPLMEKLQGAIGNAREILND